MLQTHNTARAQVSPPASPALVPLTWNSAAQQIAQSYSAQCTFAHNANRGNYGENLYASTNQASATEVVQSWVAEAANYTYSTNSCKASAQCGHYTQVVWRATTSVGCGLTRCTTNSPFPGFPGAWYLWVCDYAPPGNYVGQRPY